MRKTLAAVITGCAITLGSGPAVAVEALCSSVTTLGQWIIAGSCLQGDKIWTFTGRSDNLGLGVKLEFGGALFTHNLQIIGFDDKDAADSWNIKYNISVLDPTKFFISDMFAGADNPGGGSLLTKDVSGDPGGPFTLTVLNGAENPLLSEKHDLTAILLLIDETFSVGANNNLLSVSNTYIESRVPVPTPETLSLLGLALVALGAIRRTRRES